MAVDVFDGNTGDAAIVAPQISRVRQRFGLQRVVVVGDRGMLTEARLREELAPVHLDWITAPDPSAPAGGALQLSRDLAEITPPEYPGERLVVCRNPLLAAERPRKREALLAATERELDRIAQATRALAPPPAGREQIALRVGQVLHRFKVGKHFRWEITDQTFTYERDQARIAQEAALDRIYVIRTTVPSTALGAEEVVRAYKRCLAWSAPSAPSTASLLFEDEDKKTAVVAPAQRSPRARRRAQTKQTDDGLPVHSFRTLLATLVTLTKNQVRSRAAGAVTVEMLATPTPVQELAFDLLQVSPRL